ncbi:hypothetical protein [Streptomyces sp. NPDC003697]
MSLRAAASGTSASGRVGAALDVALMLLGFLRRPHWLRLSFAALLGLCAVVVLVRKPTRRADGGGAGRERAAS